MIITVLPKANNEDLKEKVIKIAEKRNAKLYGYNICTVHWLTNKGDAIVVKMNNQDKKTRIIKEGRKRELKCRELGLKDKKVASI